MSAVEIDKQESCPFHPRLNDDIKENTNQINRLRDLTVSWHVFVLFCGLLVTILGLSLWRNESTLASLKDSIELIEAKHIKIELILMSVQKDIDFIEKNQLDLKARMMVREKIGTIDANKTKID